VTAREVVVFDMDGVLVDVRESYREAIMRTVKYFTGTEIPNERIQELKNEGGWNNDWALSQKICRDLGFEIDYETVVAYFQSIFFGDDGLITRERWLAKPGVLEQLNEVYRLAIFTGRTREEAGFTLDRYAKPGMFDPIITTDDVVRGKPDPEGLHLVAKQAPGAKLWYVGDTVDDARAARTAGVPFIGITAGEADLAALLTEEGAIAALDDINELRRAIA
jgi:HAD superfamily phosphatase